MTPTLGLIAIQAALILGLLIALWRQSKANGKLQTEVFMLRASQAAQAGATAAMSQLPDTQAGAKEILAEAQAREKAKK